MQFGYAVAEAAGAQGQYGHAEELVFVGGVLAAEGEEAFEVQPEAWEHGGEVFFDQAWREAVDAGGYGSVRGEDLPGGDGLADLVEAQAGFFAQACDAFEGEQGGVAFVDVEDGGVFAEGGKGFDAPDAEDDLLLDAGFHVPAVEVFGDIAVGSCVLWEVGVQEVERDAADVCAPDADGDGSAGEVDADFDLCAGFGVDDALDGLVGRVDVGVDLLLVAVGVEVLVEVAVAVEEADGDEWDGHLGGAFEVVAGEAAEAAGVDLEALGDAELGAEVGDLEGFVGAGFGGGGLAEPGARGEVLGELCVDGGDGVEVAAVGGGAVEFFLGDRAEELDGVVPDGFPEFTV